MHYQVIVAIPGVVAPGDVSSCLVTAMDAHAEQDGAEWPGWGEWDWWVVGGLWRGAFTLTPDALRRRCVGTLDLPIDTDVHLGGFPQRQLSHYDATARIGLAVPITTDNTVEPLLSDQTDCARLRDIEPGSVLAPFYWLQDDGRLHDLYYGPDRVPHGISAMRRSFESRTPLVDYGRLEETNTRRFGEWLEALAPDTWMVNVDAHR